MLSVQPEQVELSPLATPQSSRQDVYSQEPSSVLAEESKLHAVESVQPQESPS